MNNYMHEVTPEMTKIVDGLIERDFENATPDEIKTYARFCAIQELHRDEIEQIRQVRQEELKARKESIMAQKTKALETLDLLAQQAVENLERANNG